MQVLISNENTLKDNSIRATFYDDSGAVDQVYEITRKPGETLDEMFNRLLDRIKIKPGSEQEL